ncbi:MAG TPA: SatD family protein [Longimicrobiales bacterium]|nr:SatD family protein [Longimicrobiales bacterium]
MTYFVLIGDLVDSRGLPDRAGVQARLRAEIETLNLALGSGFAAPLRLTAGDELQVLTLDPPPLVDVLVSISDAVLPAGLSWGLGRGPISTALDPDVSLVDGPCFHRAREAVESAKRSGRWVDVRGFPGVGGVAIPAILNLVGALRDGWTARQAEVVQAARGRLQVEVAEELGVHASTVSRTLAAAHLDQILEGEAAARALLAAVRDADAHTPTESAP